MRFLKLPFIVISIITLLIITFASIIFYTRITLINAALDNYFEHQQSEITCLDIGFKTNFNLIINKLCLKAPLAAIEVNDVEIEWQSSSHLLLAELTSTIKINSMMVQGTSEILPSKAVSQSSINKTTYSHLPNLINKILLEIAAINIPASIDINKIRYFPYSRDANKKSNEYFGHLSTNTNEMELAIGKAPETNFISVKIIPDGSDFTGKITADLAKTRQFLASHEILSNDSQHKLNKPLIVGGTLHSQFDWRKESLKVSNQLDEFFIFSDDRNLLNAISTNESFKISGGVYWNNHIKDNILMFEINEKSQLNIKYGQQYLNKLLATRNVPSQLNKLLKDNPLSVIEIKPQGLMTIDFHQADAFISNIKLTGKKLNLATNNKPINITLQDIALTYVTQPTQPAKISVLNLNQFSYVMDAQLQVASLLHLSKEPLGIIAQGQVKQNQHDWQMTFEPRTQITVDNIAVERIPTANISKQRIDLPSELIEENSKELANEEIGVYVGDPLNKLFTADKLVTHVKGNIKIAKNDITHSQNISLKLQLDSKIKRFYLANKASFEQVNLVADIIGDLNNLSVNADIIADNVAIANIKLSGDVFEPTIVMKANNLLLTDLLGLKIQMPLDVELIDGMLNYHLSGQLTNLTQPMNNSLQLSLSLKEVTGKIADTWMQTLNYEQKFMLKNGELISVNNDNKLTSNLSIALIETLTPITNFTAKAMIYFTQKIEEPNTNTRLRFSAMLSDIGAEAFGGRFEIAQAQWPIRAEHSANVQLTSIDLEALLELDKQQGIVVTGKISGHLPVSFDGKKLLIKKGELHNVSNGVIQVMNNPAVAELKANSTELKLAFDALQNLHYHHLISTVSMANDGYMFLETEIKGRNPDLDNEVNLNLNLSYDLLGLLESYDITGQIENKVIQHSQNKSHTQ